MKNFIYTIAMISIVVLTACNEDEIILSKPGAALPPVENLNHTIMGSNVNLTWQLPSSFPDDIIEPVEVQVKISVNGQNAGTHVLSNAPENYTYTPYDPSKNYRFTVKVMGEVSTENPHVSLLRYSLGKTVVF